MSSRGWDDTSLLSHLLFSICCAPKTAVATTRAVLGALEGFMFGTPVSGTRCGEDCEASEMPSYRFQIRSGKIMPVDTGRSNRCGEKRCKGQFLLVLLLRMAVTTSRDYSVELTDWIFTPLWAFPLTTRKKIRRFEMYDLRAHKQDMVLQHQDGVSLVTQVDMLVGLLCL